MLCTQLFQYNLIFAKIQMATTCPANVIQSDRAYMKSSESFRVPLSYLTHLGHSANEKAPGRRYLRVIGQLARGNEVSGHRLKNLRGNITRQCFSETQGF